MRAMLCPALALTAMVACSSKDKPKTDDVGSTQQRPISMIKLDAGVPSGGRFEDRHLDDEGDYRPVTVPPSYRGGRPIDVTLRSSPPGANVSVDGQPYGNTPAFWNGDADGHEHEFLFSLRGYGIARYRFVPVSSGVIHARLEPIAEETDAGVPPPEVVPPQPKAQ